MSERRYFRIRKDTDYRTRDHLQHGYEEERDYRRALRELQKYFADRVGEAVGKRYGFTLLRFRDAPDGSVEERWLPDFLLQAMPPPSEPSPEDETEKMLDEIFGFD